MRLIDADKLKRKFRNTHEGMFRLSRVYELINNAPTVELDEDVIQAVLNKKCMTVVANEHLRALYDSHTPCYQTTSCLDCKMYDKENHRCPRFCEVIRELVKEVNND